jgi:phage host-nuclease inhibitor protein Gam
MEQDPQAAQREELEGRSIFILNNIKDLQKRVEDYKKAKKTDLVNIQKTIDSLSSAMKEACSKVLNLKIAGQT